MSIKKETKVVEIDLKWRNFNLQKSNCKLFMCECYRFLFYRFFRPENKTVMSSEENKLFTMRGLGKPQIHHQTMQKKGLRPLGPLVYVEIISVEAAGDLRNHQRSAL